MRFIGWYPLHGDLPGIVPAVMDQGNLLPICNRANDLNHRGLGRLFFRPAPAEDLRVSALAGRRTRTCRLSRTWVQVAFVATCAAIVQLSPSGDVSVSMNHKGA